MSDNKLVNIIQGMYCNGTMGLLPDTQNRELCMRRNAGNVFAATDFKGNNGTSLTGSLTRGGGGNVPDIPQFYVFGKRPMVSLYSALMG